MKRFLLLSCIIVTSIGCANNGGSNFWPFGLNGSQSAGAQSVEYERKEANVYDPYAITDMGPDTGTRPREYANPVPETTRARKYQQFGAGF